MFIEALWNFNWNLILMYGMLTVWQFLILAFTVIFQPTNKTLLMINAIISSCFILNESRQLVVDKLDYFKEPFNYMDIGGNICIIVSAISIQSDKGYEFYADKSLSRYLILGVMLIGLRAVSALRIFEQYRVQIQLFKQVFVDFIWFMSLLMMLVVILAIVFGIQNAMVEPEDKNGAKASPDSMQKNFLGNVGKFYMFMLGETPYEDFDTTSWIVYII